MIDTAQKIFGILTPEPNISVELFLTETRSRAITWADGRLDMENQATQCGLTVRLLKEGRQATASTQDFSEDSARAAWRSALEALAFSQPDPAITFPGKAAAPPGRLDQDAGIFQRGGDEMKKTLEDYETRIRARDRRLTKVIRVGFSEGTQEWAVVNSRGACVSDKSTESSFGLEVLAEEAGRAEVSGRYQSARFSADLAPEKLIETICEEALESLGAAPVPSGNYPVVFDPWVGCQFLDLVAQAVCADRVQKGKSFFGRPEKQKMASPLVTLVDDGLFEKGVASSRYDDEGTPRRRTVPVQAGSFQALLYDATSAQRDHTASTGNGGRASFSRPPSTRPSNFYLSPGSSSRHALIAGVSRGLLLQEVMGMHTADPVSGDFSVGAQGRWIEGGKLTRGVRGVTLAGNLKALLNGIDAVGDDLTWYGSTGTPTFRVVQLTIGGT
jgi:PmbA protein